MLALSGTLIVQHSNDISEPIPFVLPRYVDKAQQVQESNIEVRKYVIPKAASGKKGETPSELCAICMMELIAGETAGSLDCGHVYHDTCIQQWLTQSSLHGCPMRCNAAKMEALSQPTSLPPPTVGGDLEEGIIDVDGIAGEEVCISVVSVPPSESSCYEL